MIWDSQIHIFDGVGSHCGMPYTVNKGDSISSITFRLAKLDPEDNWKTAIRYPNGREVRAAIWLVKNGFSIENSPDYVSDNKINTNDFTASTHADGNFQDCKFTFASMQEFSTTSIYIGLVIEPDNGKIPLNHLCCERTPYGQCLLTLDFTSGISTIAGGLRCDVVTEPYEENEDNRNPTLTIKGIRARTLSKRGLSSRGIDLPSPTSDDFKISKTSKINGYDSQWNTKYPNHPWANNDGFDIENYFKDSNGDKKYWGLQDFIISNTDITANNSYTSADNPYWVFDRSRILFTFDAFNSEVSSKIWYKIDEQGGGNTSSGFVEASGLATSLLICPRDEGIGDNEAMTIKFWRCTYDKRGRQIGKSSEIAVYFRTFVKPEVHIAYPKNLPSGKNYILWANEVINNPFVEDRSATNQVCAALNVLLTKDGGDNSNYPVFTRIYIAEYKGTYGNDGTFDKPSNKECLRGTAERTADWRGIQLDDGTIFQLTGMKNNGFTWDYLSDENNPSIHTIATSAETIELDRRMYFRAGYKYLIKVRRFHSAAAGAVYRGNGNNMEHGGNYNYNMNNNGLTTVYPPAVGSADGYPYFATQSKLTDWIMNTNNVNINEVPQEKRWVGPADGSSGVDPLSAESDVVYPGFSSADYVVIDCVHAMSTRSNIITMRPAIQEIGADHWITFGYRHLNKTPNFVDMNDYTNRVNELSETERENINADGSIKAQSYTKGFGLTWSGYDNTAKRIKLMYETIVKYAVSETWKILVSKCNDETTDNHIETLQSMDIRVYIDHQGFSDNENGNWIERSDTLLYDETNNSSGTYSHSSAQGLLAAGTISEDWMLTKEIFYGCNINNGDIYGNQYMWFPVIGNTTSAGKNLTNIYKAETINHSINKLSSLTTDFSRWKIDVNHPIIATNTYQEKLGARPGFGVSENWKEWYSSDGYLYTSDSGDSSSRGGAQMFTQNSATCDQHQPGKLYLRVPPSLDCENGVPTSDRRAIPTRYDAVYPITRTSHFCWFKTHIFGHVKVQGTAHINVENIIESTDAEGNVTTRTESFTSDVPFDYNNGVSATTGDLGALNDIGTGRINGVKLHGDNTYCHILTVYGEDNNGLGRCISADDSTALWYNSNKKLSGVNSTTANLQGAIEIPILVRYTPLVQPIITQDSEITGPVTNQTLNTNNEISVTRRGNTYKESNSSPVCSPSMQGKESFGIGISYGMYRSAMAGAYKTDNKKTISLATGDRVVETKFEALNNVISSGYSLDKDYNTDIFPSVGICNAFTVLLIPSDGKLNGNSIDYTKQAPNWFSNRANYEDIASASNPTAKTVIVYDIAKTKVYALNESADPDHKLNTTLNCEFNYANLFTKTNIMSNSKSINKTRKHVIKENMWYDLVVVPVFTNESGFNSTAFTGMDFKYEDGAGKCNNDDNFGSGYEGNCTYYGSTPLVVRKFLKLHLRNSSDGGSGGGGSSDPVGVAPIPFETLPCILYPNVNTKRYDSSAGGRIHESPGFWLDNTFRVVIRGPHFRSDSEILETMGTTYGTTLETSLESATNGELKGPDECKNFVFTDLMIHIGKYDGPVLDREGESFEDTPNNCNFNDESYQKLINEHALDREWLNARGLYSMRNNPEAFSKCTSAQSADNDARDVITGGALNTSESVEEYCNRLIEFNPHLVNAFADSAEGYYIQIRYLNNEYGGTQVGKWSEWYGGIEDDEAYRLEKNKNDFNHGMRTNINYCVPVRSYQDIFTGFRSFIKESYPGSRLMIPDPDPDPDLTGTVNTYVQGAGSGGPNSVSPSDSIIEDPIWYNGYGNHVNTSKIGGRIDDYNIAFEMAARWYKPTELVNTEYTVGVDPKHVYLEMNYVDYIIRNMAKLYFANYSESLHNIRDIPFITYEDIGWTPAMACGYRDVVNNYGWPNYSSCIVDTAETDWRKCVNGREQTGADTMQSKYNPKYSIAPNRYFRKPIGFREFDQLLNILKKITAMLRDSHITGTTNFEIDPKDSNGYGIGINVLPISPELLDWKRLSQDPENNRMSIGHTLQFYTESTEESAVEPDYKHRQESNYIQQLMEIVTSKITNN